MRRPHDERRRLAPGALAREAVPGPELSTHTYIYIYIYIHIYLHIYIYIHMNT